MAKYIINCIELGGICSGSFIGYKYGNDIKTKLLTKYPYINSIYTSNKIADKFKNNPYIDEKIFFNLIGGLGGIGISWYLYGWVIFIPMSILELSKLK